VEGLRWAWLGRVGWSAAAGLQESLRRRVLEGDLAAETLLLCEHDPVITLGRAARADHVLASAAQLAARGIERVQTTRGGDVTYHGPGQLVAYPVVRLSRGVVAHIEAMAGAAIAVAAAHGIEARYRRDCPGVWVGDGKLAAFGVHVHRRVAIHGVALNVATALDAFDLIVPCGLAGTRATSLAAETGRALAVRDTVPGFVAAFMNAVQRRPIEIESLLSPTSPVE
jgi:lipoyl(octanoyl) transferase